MNTRASDDSSFKTGDADSYNDVVDYFDHFTDRFSQHLPGPMLELAAIQSQHKILDVGTGTGVVALSAASRLNGPGVVTGIDLSDGMLANARDKAEKLNLGQHCRFLKMDAEKLDFEDACFDSVVSLYALRHFPNPEIAVREFHRVIKEHGRIVIAVGSRPTLLSGDGVRAAGRKIASLLRKARGKELVACEFIDRLVEEFIPGSSNAEVTEWSEHQHEFTGSVEGLLTSCGFCNVQSTWRGQYSIIESVEDFWSLQMTFSSLARKRIGQAEDAVVARLKEKFTRECETVLARQGRLVYQSGAAIISASKPAD